MPEPLDDYTKKRDFGRTPEPKGKQPQAGGKQLLFVVHLHEARQLHYDLRLEVDGVLMSFAVPKGFSYNPTEKRLAVRTDPRVGPDPGAHGFGREHRGTLRAGVRAPTAARVTRRAPRRATEGAA